MIVELQRESIHSPFGGSIAARVLRCDAAVDLTQKVPAYLKQTSPNLISGNTL
jgi:hypothetical protein